MCVCFRFGSCVHGRGKVADLSIICLWLAPGFACTSISPLMERPEAREKHADLLQSCVNGGLPVCEPETWTQGAYLQLLHRQTSSSLAACQWQGMQSKQTAQCQGARTQLWSGQQDTNVPRPTLAQARPQSQKSRQNSGSTPTPCLDKPVLARNTHNSKAQYVTAMPGVAMLAMAQNHIQTNSMGLQCVVNVVMNRMHTHRHE